MKQWLAALLIALTPPAWADDWCREQHLGVITVSRHLDPARKYNEEHWGPYWRCQASEVWSWQVGKYRNSYDRNTFYGLVNYVPWSWKLPPLDAVLKMGGSAGLGTGYAEHRDGTPKSGLSPVVGGIVAIELENRVHFGVFFNTAVVALVAEIRWR